MSPLTLLKAIFSLNDYLEDPGFTVIYDDNELLSDSGAIEFGSLSAPYGVPIPSTPFTFKNNAKTTIFNIYFTWDVGDNFVVSNLPQRLGPGEEASVVLTYDATTTPSTDFITVSASNASNFIINVQGLFND